MIIIIMQVNNYQQISGADFAFIDRRLQIKYYTSDVLLLQSVTPVLSLVVRVGDVSGDSVTDTLSSYHSRVEIAQGGGAGRGSVRHSFNL